jgi:mannose-6-phosphate isomerase-like protein (cupin superfamily)
MSFNSRERFFRVITERFRASGGEVSNIEIRDLPLTQDKGRRLARKIIAFPYGEEKNGSRFQIFRLGWFATHPWGIKKLEEIVVLPDHIYLPHFHKKAIGRFVFLQGSGFVSRGDKWSEFGAGSRMLIPNNTPHGFVIDPTQGSVVFISEQSSEIKNTRNGDLDFFPASDRIPEWLLAWQAQQLKRRLDSGCGDAEGCDARSGDV